MSGYYPFADRDSEIVQAALTRKCLICKATPGEDCTMQPIGFGPLPGRLVHYARCSP